MTNSLTDFQKTLCNRLQKGLPIDPQPFARIAGELDCAEEQVLEETLRLKDTGIIRRIAAILNHRVLGMHGTLVAAHVPQHVLSNVAEAVNQLAGVSHSYLRRHHFNLWFTLQDRTPLRIDAMIADLHKSFDIDFHSLLAVNVFKLDVRFDAVNPGQVLLEDASAIPQRIPVELTKAHEQLLSQLQGGVEVTSRPFHHLAGDHRDIRETLALLRELGDLGVIRRIAAVVDHRKLGFVANVLFVAQVSAEHVVEAGRRLARFSTVSHCYERQTFEHWPYKLYAMLHGQAMTQIQQTVDLFIKPGDVSAYEWLPTQAELKKQPIRLSFGA